MKHILALLADFANGLFALVIASYLTETEILWWYIPIALMLSQLPDVDAVIELSQRGRVSASSEHPVDHRELFHKPILFVFAGVGFVFLSPFWGYLFLIATTLHFFNDFYGTGWGIPLLWPFTNRRYKLLGRRANLLKSILQEQDRWDHIDPDERRLRLVVSWSKLELPSYIEKYGLDHWIEPYYLRLNWISGVEYFLFLLSLFLLVLIW